MGETNSGMGWIGVLFIVLVIWAIFGGNLGGMGGRAAMGAEYGCGRVSNCEVEKQEIIDSARTQYMIEQQGATTRAATQAGFEAVMAQNSRIYEQGLQETIFDLKLENQSLKSNIFVKDQTDALAKQYAECCCEMNRRLDGIECSMLKRPNLYGVAATCTGQVIPNGALGALGTGTVLA